MAAHAGPALLLDQVGSAPPWIGPEFAPAPPWTAVSESDVAAAANSAGVSLVAWTVNGSTSADVYAARVDAQGSVLDPQGIPLASGAFDQSKPAVVSDGSGWFVAWTDRRDGGSPDIFGSRVSSAGVVLDPQGFAISRLPSDEGRPAVAYDGTSFFVVWSAASDVRGARVDAAGNVLDTDAILVATRQINGFTSPPRVAAGFDGTNWLAVWDDRRSETQSSMDVLATRVNATGNVVDQFVIAGTNGDESNPSVGCAGATCLVAWDETSGIDAVRVSGGTVLDSAHLAIGPHENWSSIANDGTNWLVTGLYSAGKSLRLTRLLPDGGVLDTTDLTQGFSGGYLVGPGCIARAGTRVLAVWPAGGAPAGGTYARFVDDGSTYLKISSFPADGTLPAAAASGDGWLIVWHANNALFGGRVGTSGALLDPNGVHIHQTQSVESAVASDGTNWLVVWPETQGTTPGIYGARVTADGQVLDLNASSSLVASGASLSNPRVAFNGQEWLVVWNATGAHAAARVSLDGTVLDPNGIPLLVGDDVAGGDAQWLVAGSVFEPEHLGDQVYGQRVAGDGSVLDATPFPIWFGDRLSPANVRAAYGAGAWLVAWENNESMTIGGARVDASGDVLDTSPLAISIAGTSRLPLVAHDGSDWLVTWWDVRAWANAATHVSPPYDIYGARVSAEGVVIDPSGFAIAAGTGDERDPTLTGGDGRWLVAYDESGGPTLGVRARFVGCPSNSADRDADGVPDCADACPDVAATTPDGCPVAAEGGAGGEAGTPATGGGETGGAGTAGLPAVSGSGGSGATAGGGKGGTGGIAHGGSAGHGGIAHGGTGQGGRAGRGAGNGGMGGSVTAGYSGALPHAGAGGFAGKPEGGQAGAPPAGGSEGCGCSLPSSRSEGGRAFASLLLGLGVLLRRRRR